MKAILFFILIGTGYLSAHPIELAGPIHVTNPEFASFDKEFQNSVICSIRNLVAAGWLRKSNPSTSLDHETYTAEDRILMVDIFIITRTKEATLVTFCGKTISQLNEIFEYIIRMSIDPKLLIKKQKELVGFSNKHFPIYSIRNGYTSTTEDRKANRIFTAQGIFCWQLISDDLPPPNSRLVAFAKEDLGGQGGFLVQYTPDWRVIMP